MNTPEFLAALRNEIVEAEKMEAEYVKWKLIAVGSVASISLGFTPGSAPSATLNKLELLLCAIPLICIYIDFVSINVILRIATIGAYLRKTGSKYEQFVLSATEKGATPFSFQISALYGSSIAFNLILIGLSFTHLSADWIRHAYIFGGLSGLIIGIFSWTLCRMKLYRLEQLSEKQYLP